MRNLSCHTKSHDQHGDKDAKNCRGFSNNGPQIYQPGNPGKVAPAPAFSGIFKSPELDLSAKQANNLEKQ